MPFLGGLGHRKPERSINTALGSKMEPLITNLGGSALSRSPNFRLMVRRLGTPRKR